MASFSLGWNSFKYRKPLSISNYVTYAKLGTVEAELKKVTDYHLPTNNTWYNSDVSINTTPIVNAVNSSSSPSDSLKAQIMNSQTLMYNPDMPQCMRQWLYLYGNPNSVIKFKNTIELDFGVNNYDKVQISILQNVLTEGDKNGEIEVFDFGNNSFTGVQTLDIIFNSYFGTINLGFRFENSSNQSSMYNMQANIVSTNP